MPFGPKQTAGISGHYSKAWAIAPWLGVEVCGRQWKPVEPVEAIHKWVGGSGSQWETRKGLEGVWEVQERCGRFEGGPEGCGNAEGAGKVQEVTVCYIEGQINKSKDDQLYKYS